VRPQRNQKKNATKNNIEYGEIVKLQLKIIYRIFIQYLTSLALQTLRKDTEIKSRKKNDKPFSQHP